MPTPSATVTPSALGCEECLKIGSRLAASAPLPDLRPCRLLRRFAEPPRDQAFPRDQPSDHRRLRSAGRLGLVLCRRGLARPRRPRHAAARSDPALLLTSSNWSRSDSLITFDSLGDRIGDVFLRDDAAHIRGGGRPVPATTTAMSPLRRHIRSITSKTISSSRAMVKSRCAISPKVRRCRRPRGRGAARC